MNLLKEKKKIAFIVLGLTLIITALIYLPVKDYEFLYFDTFLRLPVLIFLPTQSY